MDDKLKGILVFSPVIIFLFAFYYYPMIALVRYAFSNDIDKWIEIISNPLLLKFIIFTFQQTILTVIASLIIGLPTGYLLARKQPYFGSIIRSAITVPFLFPPLAILLGFVVLFGENGFLNSILYLNFDAFSFSGIVLAHTLYNVSVIARISESAFANESAELHIVAKTLGAGKLRRIRSITFPHIKPSVEAAILLVFLYSFNSFAIVLILGEVKLQTLEVMIYTQSRIRLNFEVSSVLVMIQLIINIVIIYLYTRRQYYTPTEDHETIRADSDNRILSTLLLLVVLIITWAPLIILINKTIVGLIASPAIFRDQLFSGEYDRLLGTSSFRVIINTVFFGIITALLSFIFSMLIIIGMQFYSNKQSMERSITFLTLLPMATSAISLSFALINTHGRFRYFSNVVWIFIIIAQLLASLPFASRSIISSWKRVPSDLLLISRSLSASWKMTFDTVIYPYMKSAILVAVLFSFAISIGEFGATYYLTRGEWITLSISIYKMFGSRTVILPYIYATILVIGSFMIFLAI